MARSTPALTELLKAAKAFITQRGNSHGNTSSAMSWLKVCLGGWVGGQRGRDERAAE
jgi:hypothetical protein